MRCATRWISPQFIATNRVDSVVGLRAAARAGRPRQRGPGNRDERNAYGVVLRPEGTAVLRDRLPSARRGSLGSVLGGKRLDIYREWANAIVHDHIAARPSRSHSAGIVALRPDHDGHITGYSGVEDIQGRAGEWVIDAHLPSPGTPTQSVEAGYMANAYVRMRHPDYDTLRGMLDDVGTHHPCVRAVNNAAGRRHYWSAGSGTNRLAVNQLQQQGTVDEATVDRFLTGREVPIVEGRHCTFLFRGEADEVYLAQRILGLPSRLPMRRVAGTALWYVVLRVPQRSRINYQIEVRRGEHVERFNDPLNPKHSHSPFGAISVCFAFGYITPEWTFPDLDAARGRAHRTSGAKPCPAARLPSDSVSAGWLQSHCVVSVTGGT